VGGEQYNGTAERKEDFSPQEDAEVAEIGVFFIKKFFSALSASRRCNLLVFSRQEIERRKRPTGEAAKVAG
jgi:hypothetical protein